MIFRLFSMLMVMAFFSCSSTNKLGKKDKGWVSLFDGKTLNGWHIYGKKDVGKAWEVRDEAIYLKSRDQQKDGRGDLTTDKEYENFHLKLEWKISSGGNSGIFIYVHEDLTKYKRAYLTGPEMQVLDNDKHKDGKIHTHRAGDLYDLIASSSEPVKPVGEWNKVEIISNKGKLDFYLNGVNVVSTTMFDANWKKMIAGSKFTEMKTFGTYRKGKIVLQDHSDVVWYRNIQIKEL